MRGAIGAKGPAGLQGIPGPPGASGAPVSRSLLLQLLYAIGGCHRVLYSRREEKELLDQSVTLVFKAKQEREALKVKLVLLDHQVLE